MSILSFVKYQGAGNDFILVDDRPFFYPFPSKKKIAELCHRRFGVGADGIIFLQNDVNADFRMRIFNADGGEASSCGNGLRCLLRFISDLGFPKKNIRLLLEIGWLLVRTKMI